MTQHSDTCGYHLDQWEWECTCGAVTAAPPANVRTWAHSYTLGEMTTGEADAARAMRDRCAERARSAADDLRLRAGMSTSHSADLLRAQAAFADDLALAFEAMQPRAEASGLCGRGA